MDILINKTTGIEKEKWTNVKEGLLLSMDCVYGGTIKYLKIEKIGEQSEFSKQILSESK